MAASVVVSESESPVRPWPRALLLLGRVVLGAIFLFAAYTKLYFNGGWHLGDYHFFFGMAINSYNLLPVWAVELLARVLPWFELALGIFLIIGIGLRSSGLLASALLTVWASKSFAAASAITRNSARGH
jgi:uncharacterized membrane protein YphA (DoxX/SURF4 family)